MSRRIWVAEGFASDGDIYGRALQVPTGSMPARAASHGQVERSSASVLKSHLGDIPSCPCMGAMLPREQDDVPPDARGD